MSDYRPFKDAAKTVLQIDTPSTGDIRFDGIFSGWVTKMKETDNDTINSAITEPDVYADNYDETLSQLRRRLPLGTRAHHRDCWEGTVVGYEYGQVEVRADGNGGSRFCYGRNLTACDPR